MLCDPCLLHLEQQLDPKTHQVLNAYQSAQAETIENIAAHTGLSRYHVREATMTLRGTGLIWGDHYYTLSPNGRRLAGLLARANRPAAAATLCDPCLLEIADLLPGPAYNLLAQLTRHYRTTQQLTAALSTSSYKLREHGALLEGAQLIRIERGRNYSLTATGRRLGLLLQTAEPGPEIAWAPT